MDEVGKERNQNKQKHALFFLITSLMRSPKRRPSEDPEYLCFLTLSVPVSHQNLTSPYIIRINKTLIGNWELIKQSKLLKIKSKILLNLFNQKFEHKL